MTESFRVPFNRRRQWLDVYLHDVTPETFERRGGGRWGYYSSYAEREKVGLFGEIHLVSSRVRVDVVSHELIHLLCDIMRERGIGWSGRSEEKVAVIFDELIRNFWREYRKVE